jgi:nicotinate phosphoribosyltransferase
MLDNDQYKFTMQQALLKLGFASVPVEYKFKCRSEGVDFTRAFRAIKYHIPSLNKLQFTADEIDYLRSLRYFTEEYIGFLKYFRFDNDYVNLSLNDETGELDLRIRGPWFHTILFEVPILAIISEAYGFGNGGNQTDAEIRLTTKLTGIPLPESFYFADFGTRRRKSYSWHYKVVDYCERTVPKNFVGTSNLFLAMQLGLKAIGTMAHEWVQAHQQLDYRLADSQRMALENWVKAYRGDLGIALSDTINTDSFLRDFNDPLLYKLFDGVREDSEPDPIQFGHRIVNFYLSKNIDPKTKTIVFSNSLDFDKAINIHNHLHNLIGLSFGIGTNLTNDWSAPALNMVIKMVRCNGQPVAKVSNSPGKGMCDDDGFVSYLKSVYN